MLRASVRPPSPPPDEDHAAARGPRDVQPYACGEPAVLEFLERDAGPADPGVAAAAEHDDRIGMRQLRLDYGMPVLQRAAQPFGIARIRTRTPTSRSHSTANANGDAPPLEQCERDARDDEPRHCQRERKGQRYHDCRAAIARCIRQPPGSACDVTAAVRRRPRSCGESPSVRRNVPSPCGARSHRDGA